MDFPSLRYDQVKEDLKQLVDDYMLKLGTVWAECGYNEENIEQRCEAVIKHTQSLFEEMLEEEENNKNYIIKKIETYLKEANELNKVLHVEIATSGYENLPLNQVEHLLKSKVEHYRKIKEQRVAVFVQLRKREQSLCDAMGIPLREFQSTLLPEQQLTEYENYLNEKEAEKERLFQLFKQTKASIMSIMMDLEIVPTLDFEKLVVTEDDSCFKVTRENMSSLRQLHQRLECQFKETEAEAAELREKLSGLWIRLHEDLCHRESFLKTHQGHSTSTIKALKEEIKKCEELKRENIQRFVIEIRQELEDWWDRCLVDEEERRRFLPYSSECYTEDLIDLHELEVRKYRNFYEENNNIFELADERKRLWDKMLELEEKANDPERLFHNRGGQLLIEEKERKKIQKELPKVEKELLKFCAIYEEKYGKPFTLAGECITDIVEHQWLIHNNRKEKQKKAKKVERTKLLEVESKLGAQRSTTKRKFMNGTTTPLHGMSKLRRVDDKTQHTAMKCEAYNPTQLTSQRGNVNVKITTKTTIGVSRKIFPDSSGTSDMTTYTDFQSHLEGSDDGARACGAPGSYGQRRNL